MKDQIGFEFDDPSQPLAGLRLLLVEDEALVAIELEEIVREFGAEVVGPFSRVADALDALLHESISVAILDIQLDGETTFQIVDVLLERAKPALFVTAGTLEAMPEKYRQLPRLQKPFDPVELGRLAKSIFGADAKSASPRSQRRDI